MNARNRKYEYVVCTYPSGVDRKKVTIVFFHKVPRHLNILLVPYMTPSRVFVQKINKINENGGSRRWEALLQHQ